MEIGLALSGGGVRGLAHAGVIKALKENNIEITHIGGSSSGGLISILYAMGYSAENIMVLFKRYGKRMIQIDKKILRKEIKNILARKEILSSGLNSGEEIEDLYNKLAEIKDIHYLSDIKIPIAIPTIDIAESKEYIFTSTNIKENNYISKVGIGTVARASSSFPGIYKPFKSHNHIFLDGGILNNIPVKEVEKIGAKKVIAVKFESEEIKEKSNAIDILLKTVDIMGNKISEDNLEKSKYIISIPVEGISLFDINQAEECFRRGYETTKKQIERIAEAIL